MLRVGDDVRFEGCEYRIADIQLGLVRLDGVTGWFDPSMMKPAETREELGQRIAHLEATCQNYEKMANDYAVKLHEAERERDELRRSIDDWRKLDETNNAIKNDLRTKLATAEADAAAMRERLKKWCNEAQCPVNDNLVAGFVSGAYTGWGWAREAVRKFLDNGTAGRELLERMKKLESENAEWRRLHEALLLRYTSMSIQDDYDGSVAMQVSESLGLKLLQNEMDIAEQKQAIERHAKEAT
jgi:hypothetical protein